jgi:hypothetical protein
VVLAAFAISILGGIAAEVHATPFLLRLHPMRLSFFVCLAGAPFFARAATEMLRADPDRFGEHARTAFVLGAFLLLGAVIPLAYRWDYLLILAPALMGLVVRRNVLGVSTAIALSVAVPIALIASNVFSEKPELDSPGFRFLAFEASIGVLASLSLLRAQVLRSKATSSRERRLIVRVVSGLAALQLLLNGLFMAHYGYKGGIRRWRDVQEWCAAHLDPGEHVLVPLTQIGLRAFSDQIPAVDFQEGDALFHDPFYLDEFLEKLRMYGWTPSALKGYEFISKLDALDDKLQRDDLMRLGDRLDARVVIRRKRNDPLDLLVLFQNEDFVVYSLDGRPRLPHGPFRE